MGRQPSSAPGTGRIYCARPARRCECQSATPSLLSGQLCSHYSLAALSEALFGPLSWALLKVLHLINKRERV